MTMNDASSLFIKYRFSDSAKVVKKDVGLIFLFESATQNCPKTVTAKISLKPAFQLLFSNNTAINSKSIYYICISPNRSENNL